MKTGCAFRGCACHDLSCSCSIPSSSSPFPLSICIRAITIRGAYSRAVSLKTSHAVAKEGGSSDEHGGVRFSIKGSRQQLNSSKSRDCLCHAHIRLKLSIHPNSVSS
jgi:hypothetical protein